MAQENNDKKTSIDSENIFDEFTDSENIQDEIHKVEQSKNKDMYYYFKKISTLFFVLNTLGLIVLLLWALYIYVQNGDTKKEYSFLSPLCTIFMWRSDITPGTCYGVSPILAEYESKLSSTSEQQTKDIIPILWDIYSIENFNLSKKVSFLLEKNESRLRPLEIMSAFDDLKNTFSPTDKQEISCYNILISENMLTLSCDAFSSDWNTDIVTLNDGSIETLPWGGTSISRASSFMYFIDNYRDSPFQIIQKPQTLSSVWVQSWPYTQKTTFTMEMKYTWKNDLTF